ncbi:MAG: spermidine synthase, partial [Thermoanaerobaculia bacterium]
MFLHLIFFFSGIAGLGYELVWVRMLAVGFGHEVAGLLSVLGAFFGGLALGAALLDSRISRSSCPGRWYAGLEILIGLWGLATIALIPRANVVAAWLIGTEPGALRQWLLAFALPLVLLLPATAAMGATLPAMDRFASRLRANGRSVGGLYG